MSGLHRVVASRLLTCLIDAHRKEVQINLGEPYDANGAVTCAYEIVIGDHSTIHEIVFRHFNLLCSWSALHFAPCLKPVIGVGRMEQVRGFLPLLKSLSLVSGTNHRLT